jgi:hypothetical protein
MDTIADEDDTYDGRDDFHWYLDNQNDLVERYNGKTLVIRNRTVIGGYADEKEALRQALKHFRMGEFIVQLCTLGPDAYTEHIYTSGVTAV